MIRICVRLIGIAGLAGLAQVPLLGQAALDAARPQFGAQAAPYGQDPQTAPPSPRALPGQFVNPAGAPSNSTIQGGIAVSGAGILDVDPSKPLGRGDTVTFSIAQDNDPPQLMRVTDTGELDFSEFPKIGRISVVGRTCHEVAAELKRKLEADYYNTADVVLGINQVNRTETLGSVYLSGNVKSPGPFAIVPGETLTVSRAIIKAGGFDKFADERKVQVTRKEKGGKTERFTVDVKSIIGGGHIERDVELQDGDYINVPQRLVTF